MLYVTLANFTVKNTQLYLVL